MAGRISGWLLLVFSLAFLWFPLLALCARRAFVLLVFHSDVLLANVLFPIVSLHLLYRLGPV